MSWRGRAVGTYLQHTYDWQERYFKDNCMSKYVSLIKKNTQNQQSKIKKQDTSEHIKNKYKINLQSL